MDPDFEINEPPSVIPTILTINKWVGEDEEENVKDNWEDDDEDKKKEEQPKKQSAQSKKPKSRLEEKIEERERREIARKAKSKNLELDDDVDFKDMTPEQIQAEKLRRQKIMEEADLEVAKEMLGLSDDENVDKLNPQTKEEFMAFKDALCRKILSYKKSDHFANFIEELFRDLSANCSAAELKKFKLNMDNMFNEKMRVEKSEKGKKSKAKSKAKLRVEGDNMVYDEYSAYTIDDYDDFM